MLIKRQIILILNKLESCAVLINSDFDLLHYYNKHKQIIKKGSAHFSANIMLLAISSTTTVNKEQSKSTFIENKLLTFEVQKFVNFEQSSSSILKTENFLFWLQIAKIHRLYKPSRFHFLSKLLVSVSKSPHHFSLTAIELTKYWPKLTSLDLRQSESHAPKFNFQNCSFWKYYCSESKMSQTIPHHYNVPISELHPNYHRY